MKAFTVIALNTRWLMHVTFFIKSSDKKRQKGKIGVAIIVKMKETKTDRAFSLNLNVA